MYDISPFPSYRGQQLITPSFSDRRYRNHRQHDDHHHSSRRMSDLHQTRRPSMNEILGKSIPQRPHTSAASFSTVSNNSQIVTISPNERLHDIEIVKNLPEYPQKFNR